MVLHDGCMASRMEVSCISVCVYIALATWPKKWGEEAKHAFENSVAAHHPPGLLRPCGQMIFLLILLHIIVILLC